MGDRRAALVSAIDALSQIGRLSQISSVWETAPMYVTDQPAFLNMCVGLDEAPEAFELLTQLKAIEATFGRQDGPRNGPRPIDLDILFFRDVILDSPTLSVPHIGMAERAFVLAPLAEIAPDRLNPRVGVTIAQMRAVVDDSGIACLGPLLS
jgi:2-amino-4-hydroxy-6-hydroxymethyldihydropteridine diphosphokinase